MARSGEQPKRLVRLRSFLFGLAGLALLIAVPVVLWTYFGNPIDRLPTDLETVRGYIDQRYLPADVAIGVLSIVLWFIWLQYVWALLWEIAVVGPTAARGEIARSAPFAPKLIQSLASTVASGLLAASVVVGSPSLAALGAQMISTPAAALSPDSAQGGVDASTKASMAGLGTYVMSDGETLWSLANRDGVLVSKILELNEHQIRSAVDVRPGMELVVPASLADEAAVPLAIAPSAQPSQLNSHHVVIQDDNLWNIAAERLEAKTGQPVTNHRIAEEVEQIVESNHEVIDDPNLIYPGEVIDLPPGLQIASEPQGSAVGPPEADESTDLIGTGMDRLAQPELAVMPPSEIDQAALDAAEETPLPFSIPVDDANTDAGSLVAAGRAGIGFLSIAAGLGLFLRRLRQRRAARYGVGQTATDLAHVEEAAVARQLGHPADLQFLTWAATRLRSLRPALDNGSTPAAIRLVNSGGSDGTDCGLEVIWRGGPPPCPAGWQSGEDSTWCLSYDETDEVEDDAGVAALPGLIPIGESVEHGGLMLLNAAAYGTIAVAGESSQTDDVMRSIILQLATAEMLSNVAVTIVGALPTVFERFDNVALADEATALQRAKVVAAQRDSATTNPVEIELFIVSALAAQLDDWLELAKPGSGVVVLLRGIVRSSRLGASLTIEADGTATITPLGIQVRIADVSPRQIEAIGRLVDQITAEPNHQVSIVRAAAEVAAARPLPTPDPSNPDPLTIQVLGRMRCDALPALAGRALSLAAFLAMQPERQASKAEVLDAIWGDHQITDRHLVRVVSIVRSHLGPARFPHQSSPDSPLRLVGVDTDLGRIQSLADQAAAAEHPADLLFEAVSLIAGPPFDGASAWWAEENNLVDHAAELIEALTVQAVATLASIGRGQEAHVAATNGLTALPANEPIYRSYLTVLAQRGQQDSLQLVLDHLEDSRSFLDPAAEPDLSPETTLLVERLQASPSAA